MMSRGVATQEKFLPCKRTEEIRIFFVAGDACVSQIWAEEEVYLWQIALIQGTCP